MCVPPGETWAEEKGPWNCSPCKIITQQTNDQVRERVKAAEGNFKKRTKTDSFLKCSVDILEIQCPPRKEEVPVCFTCADSTSDE